MSSDRCKQCGVLHTIAERVKGYDGLCTFCEMENSEKSGVCYWSGNKLKKGEVKG